LKVFENTIGVRSCFACRLHSAGKAYTMLQIAISLFTHLYRKFCWSYFLLVAGGPLEVHGTLPAVATSLLLSLF